jgi:hypothetical protein
MICNFSQHEPLKVMSFESFRMLCEKKYTKANESLTAFAVGCVKCQCGQAIAKGTKKDLPDNVGIIEINKPEEGAMPFGKCVGCSRTLSIRGKGLCSCCFKKDSLGQLTPNQEKLAAERKFAEKNKQIDVDQDNGGFLGTPEEVKLSTIDAALETVPESVKEAYSRQERDITPTDTMRNAIAQVCEEMCQFLLLKNASYGDSASNPVRIFSKAKPLEQINVRIDDKLSRMMRGNAYPGDDDEQDLIGYLLLKRAIKLNNGIMA